MKELAEAILLLRSKGLNVRSLELSKMSFESIYGTFAKDALMQVGADWIKITKAAG